MSYYVSEINVKYTGNFLHHHLETNIDGVEQRCGSKQDQLLSLNGEKNNSVVSLFHLKNPALLTFVDNNGLQRQQVQQRG